MSRRISPARKTTDARGAAHKRAAPALAFLALALPASFGLAGCGGASPSPQAVAAREALRAQHTAVVDLTRCGRRHGIPLPAPTSNTSINLSGINMKVHGRKAALSRCYQKVVKQANEQQVREGQGTGREAAAAQSAQQAAIFQQQRERLIEIVACARRHGIHLPEPDAHNNVNTRGANIRTPRNKATINACARQAAGTSEEEERERAQQRASGPRRLGEEPTG